MTKTRTIPQYLKLLYEKRYPFKIVYESKDRLWTVTVDKGTSCEVYIVSDLSKLAHMIKSKNLESGE